MSVGISSQMSASLLELFVVKDPDRESYVFISKIYRGLKHVAYLTVGFFGFGVIQRGWHGANLTPRPHQRLLKVDLHWASRYFSCSDGKNIPLKSPELHILISFVDVSDARDRARKGHGHTFMLHNFSRPGESYS